MLRVAVLGVQAQEPWQYYLALQVLGRGESAAGALVGGAHAQDVRVVCRTDTARASRCPEFANRVFLLRLPAPAQQCRQPGSWDGSAAAALGCEEGSCSEDEGAAADDEDGTSSRHSSSSRPPGARLAVSLFAAPSVDAPAGPIIAGREVDRLVASSVLQLGRELVSLLLTGERVAVPVLLQEAAGGRVQCMPDGLGSQAAQLQSLRSSQAQARHVGSSTHALLELMLLGGQQATAAALACSSSSSSLGGMQAAADAAARAAAAAATGSRPTPDVELHALVSAARCVPMVPGAQGGLQPPRVCVALMSGADVAAGRPPQASTAAHASANPVWGELLVVRLQEADLAHEQLHIALAHSSNTSSSRRTLAKGSLRLSGLLPGQPYSLALSMSDSCVLYLTLHLGLGAQTQLAALQGSGLVAAAAATAAGPGQGQQQGGSQAMLRLLQAGLPAAAMGQLAAIIPGALRQQLQSTPFELWLVWRSPSQQQQRAPSLYMPVDGREGAAAATAVALRAHNSRSGLLAVAPLSRASSASNAAAARAAGGSSSSGGTGLDGVLAALPWQTLAGMQLWKQQQLDVLVPFLSSGQAALVLELHLQPYPPPSGSGSKLPAPVSLARLVLPGVALAAPSGRVVGLGNQQLASLHTAGSAVSLAWQGAVVWDVPDYLARLQQLCRQPPQRAGLGARDSHRAAAAAAASLCHAQQQQQQQQQQHRGSLDLLVADVLAKQQALERLQRQLDVTGQCAELAETRLTELRSANSTLAADLQHLRQLLHDEKEAAAAARGLLDPSQPGALLPGTAIPVASASREQLLAQLARVLEGGAKERARNAELVRRLQQLHSERVDVLDLQRQHFELQEAHFQQSKLLVDQGINVSTLALLKKAVLDQEALISRLQQLLGAAAGRGKELEGWRSTADALQAEVVRLRAELDAASQAAAGELEGCQQQAAEQAAAAAAAAAHEALARARQAAAQAAAAYDARLAALESDSLSAVMRSEAAEGAALAAQNELVDVTKRYARELAQLKTRLAEKDAQLLGGFGSIAHLTLEELAPPPSPPTLAAGPSAAFGCGRGAAAVPRHPAAAAGSSMHLPGLRQTAAAEVAGTARNSRPPSGAGGSPVAVARQSSGSSSTRSHYQQQQQQQQCTPPARQPRAGSAEARLSHQGSGRQPNGAGLSSSGSKPGSPLLPSTVQQRQQQQPQGPVQEVAAEDDDEADEDEDDDDSEAEEDEGGAPPARQAAATAPSPRIGTPTGGKAAQHASQPQPQQPSPRKGLAGFFSRSGW